MELHLKKNAAAEIMFPMVDSATPASLKSGVAPADDAYSRDGAGAWAALAITDTATEIGATGMYTIELTAAELNHDLIMIKMAVAGAADSVIIIRTFTNNIDSTLTANVTQIGGVAQSATDLKDLVDTGYDPAAHKVQGVVLTDTCTTLTGHTPQTGDSFARLGAPAGVSVSADIAAIEAQTDDIGIAGAGLTALGDARIANLDATISSRTKPADTQAAVTTVTNLTNAPGAGDFTAAMKISLNAATPASVQNISAQTGDSFARLGAPAGVSVSADIAAIEAQTDDIGIAGAGLTALGDARIANLDATVSTRATPAQVNTEVDTALADVNLDHIAGTAVGIPAIPAGTYIDQMMDDGIAAYDRTTDSLQAIRDASVSNPVVLIDTTIAVVTDQTHFTLTAGSDINNAYLNQAIVLYDASNFNYPSVRKVSAYVGATKTVTLDSAPGFVIIAGDGVKTFVTAPGTTAPTEAQVADAVWDELMAGHAIAGSSADTLSKIGKKVDRNFVWLLG